MTGFPGFETARIETSGGMIHARVGGPEQGPPLLLLHGFPQTHLMWARVAAALADTRRVIVPDLPGYGESDPPEGVEGASKRAMAARAVEAMASLGHERFDVAGHDRGGRVAYRMAFDHPERVARLAVLDILPTWEYWDRMGHAFALKIYHWAFLAQPEPVPERLIGAEPDFWIDHTIASWTASGDLSAFDPVAVEAYRANARNSRQLKAMCDDYRAGATVDFEHDDADREAGRRIACPTLVLWGATGIAAGASTPLDTWRDWAGDVRGEGIEAGHFIPEENPDATAAALMRFFAER